MQRPNPDPFAQLPQHKLVEIIRTQAEIARLGPNMADVMALVTERACTLTNADGAAIELLEGAEMVYRAASGMAANQLGLRLKASASLSGYCTTNNEAINCPDAEQDPRVDLEACHRIGLRSMMVFPLRHADMVQGVLKVMSRQVSAFSDVDRFIVELLCDLVAAAMYHAARMGQDELHRRATRDSLTALPNRAAFYDQGRRRLAQAARNPESFAVIFLDMDSLKPVNDSLGHEAGDTLLREISVRLAGELRTGDFLARLGGDEFAIMLSKVTSRSECEMAVERFQNVLQSPLKFHERELQPAASFGFALYPADGRDLAELLSTADKAMYENKRARKAHLNPAG